MREILKRGLDQLVVGVGLLAGGCLLIFATIALLSEYGGLVHLVPPHYYSETVRSIVAAVYELGCVSFFWLGVLGLIQSVLSYWKPGGSNGAQNDSSPDDEPSSDGTAHRAASQPSVANR